MVVPRASMSHRRRPARGLVWRARTLRAPACGVLVRAMLTAAPICADAQTPVPASYAGVTLERDTSPRLSESRLRALGPRERAQWNAYLQRSRARLAAERALVAAELRQAGRTKWVAAPYIHAFSVESSWTDAWFSGDSARRLADNVLTWQTPSGGWSKHVDMAARAREPGESYFSENAEWQWIGTFDNDATTTQLYLLGRVYAAQRDARHRRAFERGLDYVLEAQYPNGCWPQVYPLQGGYHDNATFNDNNVARIGALLRAVAGGTYDFVTRAKRRQAKVALQRLLNCVLASQVVVDGQRTVWGQQHDPLTLKPTSARSYELPSLTGKESTPLVELLMDETAPAPEVVEAVHAAVRWFRQNAIHGLAYRNAVLTADSSAGPLWARMAEIGTNRPMFFNRDGVRHYDWNALTDRRTGYAWYTDEPVAMLARYEGWAKSHPSREESSR